MTGELLIELARQHLGERYVLGSIAPKNMENYRGPWDCAEFCTFIVYQASSSQLNTVVTIPSGNAGARQIVVGLYGCANNEGDPAGADAYSGFWDRDARQLGRIISIKDAYRIPGAALLRVADHGLIGHIVFSDGRGGTYEAHSTRRGVIADTALGRRWDYGVLVPWITYTQLPELQKPIPPLPRIFRLTKPMMRDEAIKKIQAALRITADGIFGRQTYESVRAFQAREGLVADGEVGAKTWAALFD